MSGVWVFRNGTGGRKKKKALVHSPSGQLVRSYAELESQLRALGWERLYEDPARLQFHRHKSLDIISLPLDFASFSSVHMFDVVVKNQDSLSFRVVEVV